MQSAADFYRAYIVAEGDYANGPQDCQRVWSSFLRWLARRHGVDGMGTYPLEELGALAREFGYHRNPGKGTTPFDLVDDAYGKMARLVIATYDSYTE